MSRNRPKKLLAELGTIRLANDLFGRRGGAWPAALGDLLDTPRGLKFTLNAVMKTWERIHGEVDIDELIILSALRYRAGPVYSFLVRRALDLRLLGKQSSLETDKQEKQRQIDELRTEWKDALSQIDANHLAVAILVGDVFPSAQVITGRSPWYHTNRLQSVASSRGETYMERITAGDVPRGAVRDQKVLLLLNSIAADRDVETFVNSFVAMCFPSHFPYTLAHLVRLDSRTPSEELLTRFEDWQWLKPQLLAGLAERPDILVPHVLPVFGTFGPQPGPFEHFKFDDNAVSQFFGEDRETFYRRVAHPFTPSEKLDTNFKRLLPLAAEEAQLILRVIESQKTDES